jgi:hypothetical protein
LKGKPLERWEKTRELSDRATPGKDGEAARPYNACGSRADELYSRGKRKEKRA